MRETRLHVDALLEAGLVETAEAYMEARRRYFVEKGYPLARAESGLFRLPWQLLQPAGPRPARSALSFSSCVKKVKI